MLDFNVLLVYFIVLFFPIKASKWMFYVSLALLDVTAETVQ